MGVCVCVYIYIYGKEPLCQCRRHKRHGKDPWVRKTPWRRTRQPSPVFFFFLIYFILFFNFTILYWFCHISTWICHRYTRVPHPEPSSLPVPSLWVVPVLASILAWRIPWTEEHSGLQFIGLQSGTWLKQFSMQAHVPTHTHTHIICPSNNFRHSIQCH